MAAGTYHSCALRASGHVACWGSNFAGMLGDGTFDPHFTAQDVPGLQDATAISANQTSTCALRATGQVACWGYLWGGMGDGTNSVLSTTPQLIDGLVDATAVASGVQQSCALRATGQVACWGSNIEGELGDQTPLHSSDIPIVVRGLTDATSVAAGNFFSCAGRATGGAACWGDNEFGALGDGTRVNSIDPVGAVGLDDVVELRTEWQHVCARRSTGRVACWGSNYGGQLGDGSTDEQPARSRCPAWTMPSPSRPATATPVRCAARARWSAGAPTQPASWATDRTSTACLPCRSPGFG